MINFNIYYIIISISVIIYREIQKIPGELLNGQIIDLMPGVNPRKPPSSARPSLISQQFPNQRWRRFFMNLVLPSSDVDVRFSHF